MEFKIEKGISEQNIIEWRLQINYIHYLEFL